MGPGIDSTNPRQADLYSHISVGLRYRRGDDWHPCRAEDWNDHGFNFHSGLDLGAGPLSLRRGLNAFEGTIVWRAAEHDTHAVFLQHVNAALFDKARDFVDKPDLYARLMRLIRSTDALTEKRKVLRSLGGEDPAEAALEALLALGPGARLWRYGVQLEAAAWQQAVAEANAVGAAELSLEKVAGALGPGR